MKAITEKEFKSLPGGHRGRLGGKSSFLLPELEKLTIGQGFIVELSEWPLKHGPSVIVNKYFGSINKFGNTKRFTTKTLLEDKGWAILRTE